MSEPPKSSKQSYPIPWIASYFVTAAILIVGAFAVAWYLDRPSSEFDYDDPDLRFLERIVLSDNPRLGDFAQLNGGDWQVLCLVGFQADPATALGAAKIKNDTARAIGSAAAGIREDIAEPEFALVYANGSGGIKSVRHPHGFAFAHAGAAVCASKDQPVLALPVLPR